jgi:uncharacterized membrane protein YeaQ/YmgE (transglycosylase-associated protein family)
MVTFYRGENATMGTALIWIAIGFLTGWLASRFLAGSAGVVADLVLGVVGALAAGLAFPAMHVRVPFHGRASSIFVAAVGALLLLLVVRLLRRGSPRLP